MTGNEPTYGGVNEGRTESDVNTAVDALLPSPSCDTGECKNTEVTDAERAWVQLMSAVPIKGQLDDIQPMRADVALPPGETIASMIRDLRPDNPDAYSFEEIAYHWEAFKEKLGEIRSGVETGYRNIGDDWTGTDYDAMAEQVEIILGNIDAMLDALGGQGEGGAIGQLREKQDTVAEQQGYKDVAYPAPLFFMEDRPGCAHQLHIRVPYTNTCDIAVDEETQAALEKAGIDPGVYDDIQEERDQHYREQLTMYQESPDQVPPGMTPEQAADRDATELADERAAEKGSEGEQEYQQRASDIDGDVMTRTNSTEFEVAEIAPVAQPANDTTFNDGSTPPYPGTDGGTSPSAPQGAGSDSYTPPSNLADISGSGGGDYSGGSSVPNSDGLDSDNPWSSDAGEDPDDIGGGLASGGGAGTLTPTGAGSGAGTGIGAGAGAGAGGAGAGAGLFGAPGGGGMGAGAGAGRGGGMGGRAGGAGGRMAGAGAGRGATGTMMGGGRGAGGRGPEDEEGRESWLIEDEDFWGLARFDDDNDPYK